MPAVSFYLPEDILKNLKAAAKARRTSVSRLIRTAVEAHLAREDRTAAKADLVKALRALDLGPWEDLHKERTEDSNDRG